MQSVLLHKTCRRHWYVHVSMLYESIYFFQFVKQERQRQPKDISFQLVLLFTLLDPGTTLSTSRPQRVLCSVVTEVFWGKSGRNNAMITLHIFRYFYKILQRLSICETNFTKIEYT